MLLHRAQTHFFLLLQLHQIPADGRFGCTDLLHQRVDACKLMLVEIFTNAGMPLLLDQAATSCAFAGPKDLQNASKLFLFIYRVYRRVSVLSSFDAGAFAPSAHQVSSSDGNCQISSIAAATPSSLQLRKCCAGFGGQFFFVVQKRSVQIERSKAVLHQFFSSRSIETPRPKEPGVMHVRIAIAFPVCMLL